MVHADLIVRKETEGAHIMWQQNGSLMGCFMPKVGSTPWLRYMRQQMSGRTISTDHHNDRHDHFVGNGTRWGLSEEALAKPFRFAVVRHPWDRLISFYRNVVLRDVHYGRGEFIHLCHGGVPSSAALPAPTSRENCTFHNVVHAIARKVKWSQIKAKQEAQDPPVMDAHFRPQHQLCQLHRIKYQLLLNLDGLASAPEKLAAVQRWGAAA